jgi:ATP-dependent protease ClpP protease subunit
MQENNIENKLSDTELIEKNGGFLVNGKDFSIYCLTIIGHIEGHYILSEDKKTTKYEHVIPILVAIEQDSSIDGILIVINTAGGDVEAGLAIAEIISGMSKPSVSIVVGGGHSIGVPLAVSADYSFIVPSASMTLHPVRLNGLVLGVPQSFSYFEKIQDRIIDFITSNSSVEEKKIRSLLMNTTELVLDVGTILSGQEAVNIGLIDSVGGLYDAISKLYSLIYKYKREKRRNNNDNSTRNNSGNNSGID